MQDNFNFDSQQNNFEPIQNNQYSDEFTMENNYNTASSVLPKKRYSPVTVILSCILAALIGAGAGIGSIFLYGFFDKPEDAQNNANNTITYADGTQKIISQINVNESMDGVIEAVATKVTPSVVGILTTASSNDLFGSSSSGEGSGIIYSSDGYIITNYHVIESAVNYASSQINVYLSSKNDVAYPATVVGYNISHDLAVIKIEAKNLTAIKLGDADKLKVGQYVAAIGSPGGLDFMGSVTYGIISGLNRVMSDSSTGSQVELIQTDAAINPGNSGGALVNTEGKLIGVNSSKIAATEYEGMGFAIPIDTVKEICDKIISKKDSPNPYIGITISERYSAETLQSLGFPVGAVIRSVVKDGPAYNAGLRSGYIIVEFDSQKITNYTVLIDLVSMTQPGEKVKVKYYNAGKYYTTTIEIGSNNSN